MSTTTQPARPVSDGMKTPGQVACDAYYGTGIVWGALDDFSRQLWERSAAALAPPAVVPEEVRRAYEFAELTDAWATGAPEHPSLRTKHALAEDGFRRSAARWVRTLLSTPSRRTDAPPAQVPDTLKRALDLCFSDPRDDDYRLRAQRLAWEYVCSLVPRTSSRPAYVSEAEGDVFDRFAASAVEQGFDRPADDVLFLARAMWPALYGANPSEGDAGTVVHMARLAIEAQRTDTPPAGGGTVEDERQAEIEALIYEFEHTHHERPAGKPALSKLAKRIIKALAAAPAAPEPANILSRKVVDSAIKLVTEIQDLADDSEGIAGLHHNGDVATWEEVLPGGQYEQLPSLELLREALTCWGLKVVPAAPEPAATDQALRDLARKIGEAADDPFADWQVDRVVPVLRAAFVSAPEPAAGDVTISMGNLTEHDWMRLDRAHRAVLSAPSEAQHRGDGAREPSEISEPELAALRTRAITQSASLQRCALVAYELRRRCEAFDEKAALAQGQTGAIGLHEGLRFALTEMGLWDAANLAEQEKGR